MPDSPRLGEPRAGPESPGPSLHQTLRVIHLRPQRGWPQVPQELSAHDWLGGRPSNTRHGSELLTLHNDSGEQATVQVSRRVQASQVTALHALCVAGWGISVVVSEDDRRALADGRLLPVLPQWRLPELPVYAITPRRGEQPAKVRHALALLAAHFENLPRQGR